MKIESDRASSGDGGQTAKYDRIGVGYREVRRPDPRLAALIAGGLGDARTVVNVGAGAGSYEPDDREVTAVDPSQVMLDQHPGIRKIKGVAGELPFEDKEFDAAMAVLTVHHWPDPARGLAELRRVSRRQAVFTWDPDHRPELWLIEEYLPEVREFDRARFTPLSEVTEALDAHTVLPFPIPHDFTDGFRAAYWRRPESYLDPVVRASMSTLATLPPSLLEPAVARLREDLRSGAWQRRHAGLLERESTDYGYRLVLAGD
ncbi:class I SAM-dependent methyltransferase [Streptomyces sp. NBC_01264]|uniref:class I SAM-dependent methyltransferase n=1 Tax=Streptomyces sp. NBC_01264 TaxID=2903804 RepID=UPI00225459FF|nr:class I SAM-dependent methyltransferase [Streptomyces sp. NBC_01264]MCX4783250.1 methyltransferase domain-containing protein [Streptomyces sp. NBC_01264]